MSNIYFGGDTHGNQDMKNINKWYEKNQYKIITESDFFIQLGDWGAIWYNRKNRRGYVKDQALQVQWSKKKFTTLVVPGNHENYDIIKTLPIIEKFGGKVRVLKPSNIYNKKGDYKEIYLLERGEIYTLDGKTFLALGGAKSNDLGDRELGVNYWEDEEWSEEEEENCIRNLTKYNFKVDYVVAHTCPNSVGKILLEEMELDNLKVKVQDRVSEFFQLLIEKYKLEFKEWRFGHWHRDKEFKVNNLKYICHYNGMVGKIEK